MISLRARLAFLLASAIVAVVVLAAFVTFQIVDGPRDGNVRQSLARSTQIVGELAGGSSERARSVGLAVTAAPAEAEIDRPFTRLFRHEMARLGSNLPVVVLSDKDARRIAIPLDGGEWAHLPYPNRPPSPRWALLSYLSLVTIGALALALFAAARILGPSRMLENALRAVRPDGTLASIPEEGPPEVRATARALNTLSISLAAAMESRMRLVAAAGHDLRTPMTRLRLRAEFLPEEERDVWLRDLEEMDRIADSAIRLVREEIDETSFDRTSLGLIAEEVVGELSAIGLPATLASAAPAIVRGQPIAMKRALRNLIENAARHGGAATVSVRQTQADAVIEIEDEGPGIPDRLLGRVFEPFFRVDTARRKVEGGAGLGLAIAKEIVERNHGVLSIRNRDEGGLHQEIRLPLAPAAGQEREGSDSAGKLIDAGPAEHDDVRGRRPQQSGISPVR